MSSQNRIQVAICGAGIGGLTLAVSLAKYDKVDVDIYESASKLDEIGAGIVTQPRQWKILQKLGLESDLSQFCLQAHRDLEVHKVDIPTQVPIMTFPEEARGKAFHRAHFQQVIVNNLSPRHRIHCSKRLIGYEQVLNDRVVMHFEDGSQGTCDVLVGADGIKSAVRKQMFQDLGKLAEAEGRKDNAEAFLDDVYPHWSGLIMIRSVIPVSKDAALEKLKGPIAFAGPGLLLVGYSIANGSLLNSSTVISELSQYHVERKKAHDGPWVTPGLPAGFNNKFAHCQPDVQAIVHNLENPSQWLIHTVGPLPSWVNGRVTLLGDAAHAMIPHMGSGAGQAMEDAVLLGTILGHPKAAKSNVPAILKIYDSIRRPFANDIQRRSNLCYEQFAAFADVDPHHPEKLVGEMLENWKWLWETTNDDQIEEALKAMDALEN